MTDSEMIPDLKTEQLEAVAEIHVLAGILASQYKSLIEVYVKDLKLNPIDAKAKADESHPTAVERALSLDPHDLAWLHLGDLQRSDPKVAVKRWQEIRAAADQELMSGLYLTDTSHSPFERAQFLAVRQAFKLQWLPQNQGEQVLVDMLAGLFVEYVGWMKTLRLRAGLEMEKEQGDARRTGRWKGQRVSEQEAVEEAALMVDRLQRMFLRSLRGLRDLRRWSTPVTINNPGQVNIGAEQVNAAQMYGSVGPNAKERDL